MRVREERYPLYEGMNNDVDNNLKKLMVKQYVAASEMRLSRGNFRE